MFADRQESLTVDAVLGDRAVPEVERRNLPTVDRVR